MILYTPIDHLLEQPQIRVLRTLLHRGWVEVALIYEALDVRDSISQAIARAVRDGHAQRRGSELRITAAGRAHVLRRLAGDETVEWSPARPGTEHLLCE